MKKINFLILGLTLLLTTACNKYVDDINVDPNNPSDAPIQNILNAAFTGLIIGHEGEDARLACMWSRQFTGVDRQYSSLNIYAANSQGFTWDKYYLVAQNANIAISKAEAIDNKLASGIAKIVKAHSLGVVCALYGDIPFSQANKFPTITDPIFDKQADVYAGLQTLLDSGIADLNAASANSIISATDFYFGGDKAKWIAAANTLKARFYLHVKNYPAAENSANLGIASTANNWVIPHTTGAFLQDANIYYTFGKDSREGYMDASGSPLADMLNQSKLSYRGNAKTIDTVRFNVLFNKAGNDLNYAGYWSETSIFPLVTATENWLIQAEARARQTNNNLGALESLNKARANVATQYGGRYDDYVIGDFQAGGMAAIAGGTESSSLLYEIVEEKYCSLVGQIEVFNDFRRTRNLLGLAPTVTGSAFPERFLIPQGEVDANSNVPNPLPKLLDRTPVNN
jgi:starch-binding outer membrane protein, SusD/RagB family